MELYIQLFVQVEPIDKYSVYVSSVGEYLVIINLSIGKKKYVNGVKLVPLFAIRHSQEHLWGECESRYYGISSVTMWQLSGFVYRYKTLLYYVHG